MIVKNEEEYLEGCLASAKGVVDEMVIVDTGSTDRTKAIAASFGARIFDFEWVGDFSAARNHALEQATGDWILHLDADEELVSTDPAAVRRLLEEDVDGYHVEMVVFDERPETFAVVPKVRLFRRLPTIRYSGRIHEQVGVDPERTALCGLRIYHRRPYQGREGRAERIAMMREALEEGENGYLRYCLGSELAGQGENEEALPELRRSWDLLPPDNPTYGALLASELAKSLHRAKDGPGAVHMLTEAEDRYADYTDLPILRGAFLLGEAEYEDALEAFQRAISLGEVPPWYPRKPGAGLWMAWRGTGACLRRLGRREEAIDAFREALRLNSGDVTTVLLFGEVLAETKMPNAVRKELERHADLSVPGMREALATVAQKSSQKPSERRPDKDRGPRKRQR